MPRRVPRTPSTGSRRARQIRAAETRPVNLSQGRVLGVRTWAGKGPQVVLLHGLLDSAEGWDRLARSLDNPCVAFDLPGFGHSDRAARPRISEFAKEILAGIDELGIKKFVLVGHSLGGAVATSIAEIVPDRVLALVLLAPAGFGQIRLAEAISIPGIRNVAEVLLPHALASELVVSAAYTGVVTAGTRPDKKMLERVIAAASQSTPGARDGTDAVVAAGRSKRAFHRRGVKYSGPVSVVWGDHDHLVPVSHADNVRKALPQAQIEVWAGMGHHPQHERAPDLAGVVEEACRRASPKPRAGRRTEAA
jgi:pimeloyl-ACP methyl ester carboxylesterase